MGSAGLGVLSLLMASAASGSAAVGGGSKLGTPATATTQLVVEITGGAVSGQLLDPAAGGSSGPSAKRRVAQWLGVPYAAPPVGDLRWRPPRPPAAWRPAVRLPVWNEGCTQVKHAHPHAYTKGGEDCLYLNIFAPAFNGTATARLPVMLWIHGGGYMVGSGTGNDTNGAYDVAHLQSPMVIVSINYRLNVFGFGASDALRPRDPLGGTGEGCYFLVFVQLFEKYGTLIERNTALIEKVSPCRKLRAARPAYGHAVGTGACVAHVASHLLRCADHSCRCPADARWSPLLRAHRKTSTSSAETLLGSSSLDRVPGQTLSVSTWCGPDRGGCSRPRHWSRERFTRWHLPRQQTSRRWRASARRRAR
eukprot:SAG31_NODE_1989_length_6721_cov_5.737391_8_plen_364_part_00